MLEEKAEVMKNDIGNRYSIIYAAPNGFWD